MQTDYGIDTSRWQGTITQAIVDEVLAAGKKFWYFKGSGDDDGLYTDSQFVNTLNLLRNNPIKRGVYHFSGMQDAATEAVYAVDHVWNQLQPGEVAILDIDTYGVNDPIWAAAFLAVATPRLGFKPVLYMNQNTENSLDWSSIVAQDYGLIVADYAVSPDGNVGLKHWPFYLGQQYSSTGTIGSLSPVDLDAIFVTDINVWDKYGKPEPVTPPEPTPPVAPATPDTSPVNPVVATPPVAEPVPTSPLPTTVITPPVVQPVEITKVTTPIVVSQPNKDVAKTTNFWDTTVGRLLETAGFQFAAGLITVALKYFDGSHNWGAYAPVIPTLGILLQTVKNFFSSRIVNL